MTTRPEIAEQLLRVVARRLREGHDMLDGLVFASVPGRVVTTLLRLAQRFGTWEDGHLRVTRSLRQKDSHSTLMRGGRP
ncbi:hypothetical protein AB0I53_19175 [Saccharopolyspora sp. NPDC050389]|uniref:hypothetical protein n=1 Tax=Saccharopolyspora sp. NPDC050389 TaxID=3155516 RepID=UPI0033F789C3